MKFTNVHMFLIGLVALLLGGGLIYGFQFTRVGFRGFEGFNDLSDDSGYTAPVCGKCRKPKRSCGCPSAAAASRLATPAPIAPCPRTMEPDLSKYILKSQVPSTNSLMPDMSNYMLKTECPPVPDLSKYVLKSSIPKPQPVIAGTSIVKIEKKL